MTRPINAEDFQNIVLVSDPQISPDGRNVAFVARRTDMKKGKYYSALWMADVESAASRQFTGGGEICDTSPRWSPDGKRLAFLSDRAKPLSQIYVISRDGGEGVPLTKLDTEGQIGAIQWSPDGAKIAFLFRATPP
ncbi:MAG TPA: DPP IV N-terminal domain-containing protein, partial [Chthonomonadales bacterium]|nr:DPP IV N-terminal domain-containing protein [Chthonomonadales bacterium]